MEKKMGILYNMIITIENYMKENIKMEIGMELEKNIIRMVK